MPLIANMGSIKIRTCIKKEDAKKHAEMLKNFFKYDALNSIIKDVSIAEKKQNFEIDLCGLSKFSLSNKLYTLKKLKQKYKDAKMPEEPNDPILILGKVAAELSDSECRNKIESFETAMQGSEKRENKDRYFIDNK